MNARYDIIIVGSGVSAIYAALQFPNDKKILMITKDTLEKSDSYLAQGGICVLRDDDDYESFFEDTLKAGHYENRKASVDIMIRDSRALINDLIHLGVRFTYNAEGKLVYTKEGAHSKARILYHEDQTGKEITSTLLNVLQQTKPNVEIRENTMMVDLISGSNKVKGIIAYGPNKTFSTLMSDYVILACGGIGGIYNNSTNFPHLTGDGVAVCMEHQVRTEHLNYVQIHPTTLYSKTPGRRFLISESVRGEGAKLYNAKKESFIDELLPRDIVADAIYKQMQVDKQPYVWLDMTPLGEAKIKTHFPNIYTHCIEEGYNPIKEWIPVTPAQHYFMGGIYVDEDSKTTMAHLYAVGETACNGVHGRNRLASNSLLESLIFARRAALHILAHYETLDLEIPSINYAIYEPLDGLINKRKKLILNEIERLNHDR